MRSWVWLHQWTLVHLRSRYIISTSYTGKIRRSSIDILNAFIKLWELRNACIHCTILYTASSDLKATANEQFISRHRIKETNTPIHCVKSDNKHRINEKRKWRWPKWGSIESCRGRNRSSAYEKLRHTESSSNEICTQPTSLQRF